jgi:hypothetical protein
VKYLLFTLFCCWSIYGAVFAQNVVELEADQSMSITGKGPGQDAVINPYTGERCLVMVRNIGKNTFYVRIELDGRVLTNVPVKENEKREFTLDKGFVLYLDATLDGKAKLKFKKQKEKYINN